MDARDRHIEPLGGFTMKPDDAGNLAGIGIDEAGFQFGSFTAPLFDGTTPRERNMEHHIVVGVGGMGRCANCR